MERADKDPFLVDGKGLGVETGPERSCEASTFRLVPRRKGGLELVKLDASLQEVRPLLYISAVHDDDVGGGLRIGEYPYADARTPQFPHRRPQVPARTDIGDKRNNPKRVAE